MEVRILQEEKQKKIEAIKGKLTMWRAAASSYEGFDVPVSPVLSARAQRYRRTRRGNLEDHYD